MIGNRFIQKMGFLLLILAILVGSIFVILQPAQSARAATIVTINGATKYQTMNGFGFSEAFGHANSIKNATSNLQQQMLDLLFNTSTGAGLTILRNIIPSDANHTIEPTAPATPTSPPPYIWSNNDWGQVWLSQQALNYGVKQIYADAWSAPGYMKTNGNESNGGTLCGVSGATCSSGDWRQAYANYLVQYLKDYQSAGVTVPYVGFVNEPNLTTSYSSMDMSPTQTADFVKVLGPTLATAGVKTQIVCCEPEGWNLAQSYVSGITSDSAANSYTNVFSSHGYTGAPTTALTSTGSKPIWETEWSTFDNWNTAWDDNSDASGFTWAQHIYSGLAAANLSAFLYWWGVEDTTVANATDNQGLIQYNGSTVSVSKRLWAFANYGRFVRPGATRIGATSADSNLETTAFTNTDGSLSIVVLNTSTSDDAASFTLQSTSAAGSTATPYLTNATSNTAAQTPLPISGGSFNATVPARSLVTYVIPASSSGSTPTPRPTTTPTATPTSVVTPTPTPIVTPTPTTLPTGGCQVHYVVQSQWSSGFTGSITITNAGTTAINGWTLKFTFPGNQQVQQGWSANWSQSGASVTATNASWNSNLSSNASVNIGFNSSWSGSNSVPTSFTLNGIACSVS